MALVTKKQQKLHNEALDIISQDILGDDDIRFVYDNFNEGVSFNNSDFGAFFTPWKMADALAYESIYSLDSAYSKNRENPLTYKVIDLCGGIGVLSAAILDRYTHYNIEVTCIEINPEYIKIGRKLLPQVKWIQGSVLDLDLIRSLGKFDHAVSNPPFGRPRAMKGNSFNYTGVLAEFKVFDIASCIANYVSFIIPSGSAGYEYGDMGMKYIESKELKRFQDETNIEVTPTIGQSISDGNFGKFKNTNIRVEIAHAETNKIKDRSMVQVNLFGDSHV